MSRKTMLALIVGCIPCLLLGVDSTYYFYKVIVPNGDTEDTTYSIIETYSDSAQETPSGYTAKSKAQLEDMGFLTPSEALADYDEKSEDITKGNTSTAWITGKTQNGVKKVYCGSKSARSLLNPGYLGLLCKNTCIHDNNPNIVFVKQLFKADSTWHTPWGWNTSHEFVRQYPLGTIAHWRQESWHKYSSTQNPATYRSVEFEY